MSLVDEQGRLLPAEYSNIKTLECLTKDRARSPSRRSPSRNGKKSSRNGSSSSPKLPTFVHEVSEFEGARLTSPTALKDDSSLVKQVAKEENSTNVYTNGLGQLKEVKHLASSTNSSDPPVSSDHDARKKTSNMDLSERNDEAAKNQLPKKPISLWTTKDVSVWLDHIQLTNFKNGFISKSVTGKTLCNLSYETLEELNLSNSSEERERFLAELYRVQQENERINDEETDKEIQEVLRGSTNHDKNGLKGASDVMRSPYWNAESDVASTGSFASSSRTGSERGQSPVLDVQDEGRSEKGLLLQSKQTSNTSQHGSRNMTSSQESIPRSKKGYLSKDGDKRRKSRGKRISRFLNSFHHGGKTSTDLDNMSTSPMYKNAFHNLMNTGPQGVIKVWTEMFLTDMQYVSLLVSYEATAFDVVKMVLEKSNASEDPECYRICEINEENNEYVLDRNESPLQRERQWSDPDNCRFELRWRNERLIEWRNTSGSVTQDLSFQKPEQENSVEQNTKPLWEDSNADEQQNEMVANMESPDSINSPKSFQEPAFGYNVEVEFRNEAKEPAEILTVDGAPPKVASEELLNTSDDSRNKVTSNEIPRNAEILRNDEDSSKEHEPLVMAEKLSLSSGIDSSSEHSHEMNANVEIPASVEPEEKETSEPATMIDEEQEYSRQLRKSSKKLSRRLKLESEKTRQDEPGVQTGMEDNKQEHERNGLVDEIDGAKRTNGESRDINDPQREVTDYQGSTGDTVDTPREKLTVDGHGTADNTVEVKGLGEQRRSQEDLSRMTEDDHSTDVALAVKSQEVENLLMKIKELEEKNSLLSEENRDLKKSCRTFEGKSRLKERELEDLEDEKNNMAVQMQEMSADLHSMRAENTELRTSLAEANTKLNDVDGWVTREVFEDIRGQLSVSMEEVERKEEDINDLRKNMEEIKEENKKIKVLELEVEKLNERIKEDKRDQEGMKKDIQDKLAQIRGHERENEKLRGLIEEGQKEKQVVEMKLDETENEVNIGKKRHAEERKELQKNLTDREYEVLIMKEEKKELCMKLRSIESTVETLREEMKKKDGKHEAAIAEMKQQNDIKDQSLSVTVSTLEQLVTERDQRIKELKKKLARSGKPDSELQAKEQEYEQNKLYLKHLIAIVREKDPSLLDDLNQTLSSRDPDDWC